MRVISRSWTVLRRTGAIKIFIGYAIVMCVAAALLVVSEPEIHTFSDGLWYTFIASSTIGFGDLYAVTPVGRIITVLLAMYGILATAMLTGVVVGYYMEYLKAKENETISLFLEKLEHLPELEKEELKRISEKIKKFNKR